MKKKRKRKTGEATWVELILQNKEMNPERKETWCPGGKRSHPGRSEGTSRLLLRGSPRAGEQRAGGRAARRHSFRDVSDKWDFRVLLESSGMFSSWVHKGKSRHQNRAILAPRKTKINYMGKKNVVNGTSHR